MQTKLETYPIISIREDALVGEAADLMATFAIGAIGVLGPDRGFKGIFTERDLTALVGRHPDVSAFTMAEVVNDFPVVVDGPLDEAAAIETMRSARIRHLVVKEGKDFRIVSMRDLFSAFDRSDAAPTARQVMTSPVIACRDEAHFEEAAELLASHGISGMPVVDDAGAIIGVVSERDLAHALGSPLVRLAVKRYSHGPFLRESHSPQEAPALVRDIMTSPAITAAPDMPLKVLAALMASEEINRLPVVESERLVGIVTRGDVLAVMAGRTKDGHVSPPVVVGVDTDFDRERVMDPIELRGEHI